MPSEDMEIISAFFTGSTIREGFGKLASTLAPAPVDDGAVEKAFIQEMPEEAGSMHE